jgi:diaminopimelate epimerase
MSTGTFPWLKGHGTENDFVLLPDPDESIHGDLDAGLVRFLCDRHAGIGADGVLRVIEGSKQSYVEDGGDWFMDYRNADGSVAEMCGNGTRVFAAYLAAAGLADLPDGGSLAIGTRAGVKRVRREGAAFVTDLGAWRVVGGPQAAATGGDVTVGVGRIPLESPESPLPGLSVDLGNPHTVVALPDRAQLAAADLTVAPVVTPAPGKGTNVEIVVPLHDATAVVGHLAMRVHERGVGETRSCGTGVVAAAVAARAWGGDGAPDRWVVDVPGGRLTVALPPGDRLAGASAELGGPAVLGAHGVLDLP